jgi:hypothetical protein
MTVHKRSILITAILAVLFLTLVFVFENDHTICVTYVLRSTTFQGISIGLFTGVLVSCIYSLIQYLHEKDKFLKNILNNLRFIYQQIWFAKTQTYTALGAIDKNELFVEVGNNQHNKQIFEIISIGIKLAYEQKALINTFEYDPVNRKSKVLMVLNSIRANLNSLSDLNQAFVNLQSELLRYEINCKNLKIAIFEKNQILLPQLNMDIEKNKMFIIAATSQIDTMLSIYLHELDNTITMLYSCHKFKTSWEITKTIISNEVSHSQKYTNQNPTPKATN